ncbi:hypothetical protein [Paraburkholderia elongata]|uniref:Lipocalin-like domain-containing protein n=1 Tax=Paraburkholderia elongata TaxID=2675747 RepID=A0A972NMP5_9BURK|nr:hypothetical protein [Paraburkholderia elongata]NPT56343.1 hypothetical protein [Paraburkholderia elongata]NPT56356.1 hypothetical protein [Paraburkholderia elongata]
MKKLSVVVGLLVTLVYGGMATAADSGPYLVGHWKLNDSFTDFNNPPSPIVTDNTEFVFLNPTPLTLTLEYAFFDSQGTFCGCDRDTLKPNGRTRYTMLGELQGGQFSRTLCPGTNTANPQTDGVMKTIVFTKADADGDNVDVGDAVEAGYQIDLFGSGRTESDLKAVILNHHTTAEITSIHRQCNKFIKK